MLARMNAYVERAMHSTSTGCRASNLQAYLFVLCLVVVSRSRNQRFISPQHMLAKGGVDGTQTLNRLRTRSTAGASSNCSIRICGSKENGLNLLNRTKTL